VRAGPKAAVDPTPLPLRTRAKGAALMAKFCAEFIKVPSGTGARKPMKLRPWQVALVGSVWDAEPRPRLAGWMLPRGQGKTTLVAALGLYDLLLGDEGAQVVVAATDERQANICFATAARMVELDERLAGRVQVFQNKLVVPERGATFTCLPAEARRLEGLNPSLAILDEIGVISRDVYEVVALASGKRDVSTVLGIGTPGPSLEDNVLVGMRDYAASNPRDSSFVWREHSAAGYEDHPPDCEHCWELANPGLDDLVRRDAMRALLPPKMREASFRRARLCQFVTDLDGAFLPPGLWESLATGEPVPDGVEVVLGLDGSFNGDATALLVATVDRRPHVDVAGLWEPPARDPEYRVPVADVEDAIRAACLRWRVREVVADPFRWTRTLQALDAERIPIVEFPQSAARMTPATTGTYEAAVNRDLSHSGHADLARHVGNAVLTEDARGVRLGKARKHSTRRIDLAVCLVMAHSRATFHAATVRPNRTVSFL